MQRLWLLFFFHALTLFGTAQPAQVQLKVYAFEEGLSHRNTSKILQDKSGFIWIATINGLNRFDGYEFLQYNSRSHEHALPHDVIYDMQLSPQGDIWLASPDFLTAFTPSTGAYTDIKIKDGEIAERESSVPYSLSFSSEGSIWSAVYDERSDKNQLQIITQDGKKLRLMGLGQQNNRRPIVEMGSYLYLAGIDDELWKLSPKGRLLQKYKLPEDGHDRITQLQALGSTLYALCLDGALFSFDPGKGSFTRHPASVKTEMAQALLAEANGDVWIGGRGAMWYYDGEDGSWVNYDPAVREIIKNTATYRQIFRDRSGVIWAASDFGAVKLVQSGRLFANYLNGGNEYCINVYCSTRGMTEDDKGNVYISYYNSIHVLDPATDALRILFPTNNFSNYPFGLTYYDNALWTGNGRRIDLNSLRVDTLFSHPAKDLGAVMVDKDSTLWIGYLEWLYQYGPGKKRLSEYQDNKGVWGKSSGTISCLYQGKTNDWIWVGTLDNGLFQISKDSGRQAHYHTGQSSPAPLRHNQVNAIYESAGGLLWIGTAQGLHRLGLSNNEIKAYTSEDGLPNDFINGILSEGDSCLWVSTDNGLSRFSLNTGTFSNFFVEDGITANEFNRISFFKSRSGRMYFGGLNGVNAFFPGPQFLKMKTEEMEAPILFTHFSKYDGSSDSLVSRIYGLSPSEAIVLSPWDRIFSLQFALADYRAPQNNVFSYWLEGFDAGWLEATSANVVRYNNIPAGGYTLHVRAKAGGNNPHWNSQELAIRVVVKEAFYYTWWFWLLCTALLVVGGFAFMRYRIYLIKEREKALEALVRERTRELELEKHKSEELLLNILPAETAEELKKFGAAKAKRHELVTVMFSDFKGFSRISEQMDPEDLVAEIDYCFRAFDEIMEKYGLEKIKTVGDAYLCVGGIRDDDGDEATRVTLAAMEIQAFMEGLGIQRQLETKPFFEARIGIHTGPLVAGIVGIKKFAYDIWGDTVNLASRMETNGEAGRVNISETTYQLVRPLFSCAFHGKFTETDGEDINMYFVEEYLGD
ncbi:MAG: hypothetical protein KDC66_11545 [Phaeodactylibacter sp.]|nr:hypothetical protein [Phaeodactylibacter sp.]MCB9272556.1 hypothetical protein [Lewinellaceae bacterium]